MRSLPRCVRRRCRARQAEAEMRERRAEDRARQAARARSNAAGKRLPSQSAALDQVGEGAADAQTRASPMPSGASTGPPPAMRTVTAIATQRQREGGDQPLRHAEQIAALPGQQRPERHGDQQRQRSAARRSVEERRADRNLVAGQRLERQRIERADEHRRAGRGEEQIVEHQRAFARDRREQPALLQRGRAPGKQRQRAADEDASGSPG